MSPLKKMNYLMTATLVTAGLGCGIKGPPLPPIETIEDKVNNAPLTNAPPPTGPKTVPMSSDSTIAIPPK